MRQRKYKQGQDREQGYLLPPRMEDYVREDNPVRAIDSYVDSLDLEALQFVNAGGELTPGQPAYPPSCLLKLYLYGYLHRLRSSRQLEAECQRNLEVIWLLQGRRPSYKTIADFRKDNLNALKQVNQDFVQLCKELDLFGGELVGIDGSFFRGNVAKSSIYTKERLEQSLARVEQDIARYLEELNRADTQEGPPTPVDPALQQKLEQLRQRQKQRKEQWQQLQERGETQIAQVDADARLLRKNGQTVAGYNLQIAVDQKNRLIVVGQVTRDGNDSQQAAVMGLAAKAVLGVETLETVQDEGYFNGEQIKTCQEQGIIAYIAEPDRQSEKALQGRYPRRAFRYAADQDCYYCPGEKALGHQSDRVEQGRTIGYYRARQKDCSACPLRKLCLSAKGRYRTVTRWEHEHLLEAHRERMAKEGAEKMRQRCGLCEHPFGTLKLWCGWTHFLLRGLEKVCAEWSLWMLGYNFKRVLSLIGLAAFRAYCSTRQLQPRPAKG